MKKNNIFSNFASHVFEEYRKVEIPSYDPNSLIMPPDYEAPGYVESLENGFDKACHEFLVKGNPDSDNGSYMDQVIDKSVAADIRGLDLQRKVHENLIRQHLAVLHEGDFFYLNEELKMRQERLDEITGKLDAVKKVYYRGTTFEKLLGGRAHENIN